MRIKISLNSDLFDFLIKLKIIRIGDENISIEDVSDFIDTFNDIIILFILRIKNNIQQLGFSNAVQMDNVI
jgi:hypothetical protein